MAQAYLNGEWLPLSEAKVSVLDRGFLFGDGVYEVVRVYGGKPFLLEEHLDRLANSLDAVRISGVDRGLLSQLAHECLAREPLREAILYFQITRGAPATRTHAFPAVPVRPTVFLFALPFDDAKARLRESGASVRSFPDLRWRRCDIKSINLLGNVFAAQSAKEGDVLEAVLVGGDGLVTEGSATNVFAVIGGILRTMPVGDRILPGITRARVLDLARKLDLRIEERGFTLDELKGAEEAFLPGTTTEVLPIVRCDEHRIADGTPGPLTRRLQSVFR